MGKRRKQKNSVLCKKRCSIVPLHQANRDTQGEKIGGEWLCEQIMVKQLWEMREERDQKWGSYHSYIDLISDLLNWV